MNISWKHYSGLAFVLLIGSLVCLPFMNNPLFFDDNYFFQPGNPEKHFSEGWQIYPRWWVYETIAATYVFFGKGLFWLRLGNLVLHFSVVLVLARFTLVMLRDLDNRINSSISPELASTSIACLFAIHPLAIFTQGYLIQRTILAATLFSLLSLLAFWRGLSGARFALWSSCLFFALAVYAKEHAVMLPLAAGFLLLLHNRTGLLLGSSLRGVLMVLLMQCGLALLVVLQTKGVIGTPYEPLTFEMLDGQVNIPAAQLYPLSVLNQAGLFFKYLGLWIFPTPGAISVDIRQAFPLDFGDWQMWTGALFFIAYLVGALILLLRGGAPGLLGLSLLLPAVLFFTEFAAVRLQESFVLYRSYLWFPFIFVGFAMAVRRLRIRVLIVLVMLCTALFAALSYQRLNTFSHPLLVWREAADVYETGPQGDGVFGGYRVYYDLGCELQRFGYYQLALDAFDRALELKHDYADAVNNKGAVFLDMKNYSAAQVNFEIALRLKPKNIISWNGLARAHKGLGEHAAAERARQVSCSLRKIECAPEVK
jgi:tetratricopeptide (TPR) repeat protein